MKKAIWFSLCILSFSLIQGQITLQSTDLGAIGSTYFVATDTLAAGGENQGQAGANMIWDLSTLTTHSIDTVSLESAVGTPNASDFPLANRVINSQIGTAYAMVNSSVFELHGLVGDPGGFGSSFVVDLVPKTLVMPFPYTYGTNWLDTTGLDLTIDASALGIPLVDSGRYKSIQYRDVVVDGYGTLKLGLGTYNSCLREKEITRTVDSIWGWNAFFGWNLLQSTDLTDSTFRWWDDTRGYALATLDYDDSGNIDQISYLDPNPTIGRDPENTGYAGIEIFPNPASTTLRVMVNDQNARSLKLLDPAGRLVKSWSLGLGNHTFSVEKIPSGIYFYQVSGQGGAALGSGKLLIH